MSTVVVVGAQWGDEGKGKLVDLLAEAGGLVVRYQGGNNAGHTVVVGAEVFSRIVQRGAAAEDLDRVSRESFLEQF